MPSLFDYFQKVASQTGLILEKVESGRTFSVGDSSLKEINLSFIVTGLYPDFKNFLSTIERSSKLIEVKDVSFSSPKNPETEEESRLFSFELKLKVHSY